MKKNDKQTLDMLKNEFGKSMDEIRIPERMQKNNIVEMLENSKSDFSDKTGTIIQLDERRRSKTASNATIRRSLSIAAMLIIVIGCSLLIRMSDEVNIIKTEPELNNYNAENMFKAAESYEEVEKAIQNILNPSAAASDPEHSSTPSTDSSAPSTGATTPSPDPSSSSMPIPGEYVIDKTPGNHSDNRSDVLSGIQADCIKGDGNNLYIVTGGKDVTSGKLVDRIDIVRAVPADSMEIVSTITLDESADASTTNECIEIYLHNNILVAVIARTSSEANDSVAYTKHQTVALCYDISDPSAAVKIREFVQDGSYVTSTLNGSKLCLVTDDMISDEIKNIVPNYSINGSESAAPAAGSMYIATNNPQPARVFMTESDISDSDSAVSCAVFIGSDGDSLSASGESLLIERTFVSVNADEDGVHSNLTEIYRFDLTENGIALVGSYVVDGTVCSEPSVDPSTGNLRVLSSGKDGSALYILGNGMEFIGWYDGIFPQSKIESVRFIGNVCCITAEGETMLVIDITNPEKPQKLTEAPSQGFSDDLLSVGNDRFIQISCESENSITVSLYSASDPKNIACIDSYKILGNFNPVPLEDNRSIMLWEESETLAIPAVSFNAETGSAVSAYALFSYADGDLVYINSFNHDSNSADNGATHCARIGDCLYTVSGKKIVAFSISQSQQLSALDLY